MAISTNSIIHYTNNIENILSILTEKKFNVSFCKEEIKTAGGKNYSFALAMVSFCDIPLLLYSNTFNKHKNNGFGFYGDYAIALSKKWARRKRMNPVVYIDNMSNVSTSINRIFNEDSKSEVFQYSELSQIVSYTKNYEGELTRNNLTHKKYRFYNEREWRYVPLTGKNTPVFFVDIDKYINQEAHFKNQLNNESLSFDFDDISYIILKKRSEIPKFKQQLLSGFPNNADHHFIDDLLSKIITKDMLNTDL